MQNNNFRVQGMFFFSTIVSLLYLEISVHAFHTIQSSNHGKIPKIHPIWYIYPSLTLLAQWHIYAYILLRGIG